MKKITAIGIKEEGKPFRIQNKTGLESSLNDLPNGKYKLTIDRYFNKSSPAQFGWLYACIYPMSLIALNDAGYEFVNVDEVDIFWKSMFANKEILNRETGEIMNIPKSKSEFVTVDQMAYCESIRIYCSEYLGVNIPDPKSNYKEISNQDKLEL